MIKYSIQDFFTKKFEIESTDLLLNSPDFFSKQAMVNYVDSLMDYDLEEYILYAESNPITEEITTKDITQLSNFSDCTINMCRVLSECKNCGLPLIPIAKALHKDDSYKFNDIALTKYGENQVKTAAQLGLTIFLNGLWYLTSIGAIFNDLDDSVQNKFLSIVILRDPFYNRVLCSLFRKPTVLKDYMSILSETTQKRRKSSCMQLISLFLNQCNKEGVWIYELIV